jgi:alpha-1,3-mannosyltransferase
MRQAQLFVCLSRHEGFGIAAVEAMSAGLIPVLSDIPPFARLSGESGQGILVDRDDPIGAAVRVERLALELERDFGRRREAAMAYVERYDWRHVVGRYLDEYRNALGQRHPQEALR